MQIYFITDFDFGISRFAYEHWLWMCKCVCMCHFERLVCKNDIDWRGMHRKKTTTRYYKTHENIVRRQWMIKWTSALIVLPDVLSAPHENRVTHIQTLSMSRIRVVKQFNSFKLNVAQSWTGEEAEIASESELDRNEHPEIHRWRQSRQKQ